jgi:ribonucleoside-diphosphate reductase alpha chain
MLRDLNGRLNAPCKIKSEQQVTPREYWPLISRHVWQAKYRWGKEQTIDDTRRRIARAVASAEPRERARWSSRFHDLLAGFAFLPGGRILAGAGTDRHVTLFNCFVMGIIEDSLGGIFDALKQGALTMQQGGGVGYDFSTLRPAGTIAHATGSIASGPVSFMHIWDAMCGTMLSTGARRGAMMATLRCDHPDVRLFVDAKRDPSALRHFNLSVQVSDAFMHAVEADAEWPLVFPAGADEAGTVLVHRRWTGSTGEVPCRNVRRVRARELWEAILRAAYDTAEPGVLFIDQINRENNLAYVEQLTATNPCGEIPLPPYGACNLGSLNLAAFVLEPFEPGARIDVARLVKASRLAVRFLDNVIDVSAFPIEQQRQSATGSRRIGLGVTGLADALVMLGQRYDGWTARGVAEDLMRTICHSAYEASIELAEEKGAFPRFDRDAYSSGAFIKRLPAQLRERIARHGIRNSHLLAIAPAGTISLVGGNVSSGIEPIFALEAERRVLEADGQYRLHRVQDYAWATFQRRFPSEAPRDTFLAAAAVAPRAHLEMQAALQPWVDSAISKTINVAADTPFEEFKGLYEFAYRTALKGCTVFRPNPIRGEILTSAEQSPSHCCDIEREAD